MEKMKFILIMIPSKIKIYKSYIYKDMKTIYNLKSPNTNSLLKCNQYIW